MIQRAMQARDHLHGKSPELVILSAAHGNQLYFRHLKSPQHVLGALRPEHNGMSLERDLRNIQDMVVMRMRDEHEVCPLDMRVDRGHVWHRRVIPAVERARVPRCSLIRSSARRLWTKYSRNVRINQNDRLPVADF